MSAAPSPDAGEGPARARDAAWAQDAALAWDARQAWDDAVRAADLLAADPHGLGGAVVRAGPGPVRERWLERLRAALPPGTPWRRMPAGIADDRLLGGLDLAGTLAAGRPVAQAGLLAQAHRGLVVVPMAERLPPGTAARLACALDTEVVSEADARVCLVLLDESRVDEGGVDEAVPAALADRLAFHIDLTGIGIRASDAAAPGDAVGEGARGDGAVGDGGGSGAPCDPARVLCELAEAFGVSSLRAPILAARVARALSRTSPRSGSAREADLIEAARLVLAPRATRLPPQAQDPGQREAGEPGDERPEPPSAADPGAPGPPDAADDPEGARTESAAPDEVVLDAVRAAIPPDLLARLLAGGPRLTAARSGRAGQPTAAARTGRPVGSRRGDPRRGRLDLLATLRAAAPWQRLREAQRSGQSSGQSVGKGQTRPIVVRPDDLHIRRLRQRSESTTVFCVDASGSAALERLAEAKGAVELLLAEAYVRRDRVALVAFRGARAELVLPPTRSLTRAKRGLSGLPGGGGTPLASGIDAALAVALAVRRGGGRPALVLLTDGRANVARSGEGGRSKAGAEAVQAAGLVRAAGLPALVIDTGVRGEGARAVAEAMGARYLPLPRADASRLSAVVRAIV